MIKKILILLLVIPFAYGIINISANETYEYFLFINDSLINNSLNQSFYCSLPEKNFFCGETIINISLNPGDFETVNQGFCGVNAQCAINSTINSSGLCVIDKTIFINKEKASFSVLNSACDINITIIREDEEDISTEGTREVLVPASITKTKNNLEIIIGDVRRVFDTGGDDPLSLETQIKLFCPESVPVQDIGDYETFINICREWVPEAVLQMKETLRECTNASWSHVRAMVESREADNKLLREYGVCDAQRAEFRDQYTNLSTNTIPLLQEKIAVAEARNDTNKTAALVLGVSLGFLSLIFIFREWQRATGGGL